jgi:hypothetical protein
MTIFRFRTRAAAIAGMAISSAASANFLVERTAQEKWDESTLVVVVEPTKCALPNLRGNAPVPPCEFRVVETLKGPKTDRIAVQRVTNVPEEWLSNCCDPGLLYLLYLRAGRDGRLYSVNGHWGVRVLASKEPK